MKFKLKEDSLTILEIHFLTGRPKWYYSIDKDRTTGGKLDQNRGIEKLEKKILANAQNWKFAVLRDKNTKKILHYYHSSKGLLKLSLEAYKKLIGEEQTSYFNLVLVPNKKARANGVHSLPNVYNVSKSEVRTYWSNNLMKIEGYLGSQLKFIYKNGLFKNL